MKFLDRNDESRRLKKILSMPVLAAAACAAITTYGSTAHVAPSETWRATELVFEAGTDYDATGADAVTFDAVFTHDSGEAIARPGFWDGGKTFRVRFAPTKPGRWRWATTCKGDAALNGKAGALEAKPYAGDLEIYKRGFVKAAKGAKHFTYADGTPFFYLGDTHWGLYKEEIDEPGPHAGATGAASHFKYIADRRAAQGFTVYQTEPIGAKFNVADGKVDAADIPGFQLADRYYQYLADKGFVHANAEFFFAASMSKQLAGDPAAIDRLARYWVARFGAYPVMWTLAQEADNDFYYERHRGHNFYRATNNPWVVVAESLHRADAYNHPLTAHQENTGHTTVTGRGTAPGGPDKFGGRSAFADASVAARTGHSWWGVQWSPSLTASPNSEVARDYWADSRPAVNYEGRYCYLWTKDFGARAQGYISFLSGMFGYGYGAIDIWLYLSTYDVKNASHDGVEKITPEDKQVPWCQSVEFPSALQMAHFKKFFTSFDWWNLKPGFGDGARFTPRSGTAKAPAKGIAYVFATLANPNRAVFYFYGTSRLTGTVHALTPDRFHAVRWFNTRTGEWKDESLTFVSDDRGNLELPPKPDASDWALVVTELPALTLAPGADVKLDYGGAGVGGYPMFRVEENDPAATLRISYACHPDGLGPKGDFWRETAARYLGRDIDLPILPANIDRYESYQLASNGVYRAPLLQGLVRYVRLRLDSAAKPVKLASFAFANDRVHSAGERAGTFDCEDRQLAEIWEASVRTCELSSIPSYYSVWGPKPVTTLPYIADGAKRDRLVWSGDLWWAQRSFFVGFKPSAPYMKGSVEMLAANHTPEGYVQASPWPDQAAPRAREWGPFGSDEFAAWFVPVAWDTYFYTGDRELLKKVYPVVQNLVAYLAKYQNPETGIFEQRKETCKHAAGLVFGGTSLHHRSYMNILLWKTYVDAAQMAQTLGNSNDAARWTAAADKLAGSIRATFWNAKKGYFRLSAEDGKLGFEANALALAARFATREEAERIMPQLKRIGHGKFQAMAVRGKFEYGATDAALGTLDAHNWRKVLDPDWKGMRLTSECMGLVRKGWGDEAHPDTAIAGLFTNYILGIEPTEPGFKSFTYRIPVSARINWASGRVPTPHGNIGASWLKNGKGEFVIHVNVPKGTTCRLEVPGRQPITLGPGTFRKTFPRP